jgi:hypothetical protein
MVTEKAQPNKTGVQSGVYLLAFCIAGFPCDFDQDLPRASRSEFVLHNLREFRAFCFEPAGSMGYGLYKIYCIRYNRNSPEKRLIGYARDST